MGSQPNDPAAEGARWTVKRADAFIFIVDREGLAGTDKGAVRSRILDLARRLSDERTGRPTSVVWTKSDCAVPQNIEAAVRNAISGRLGNCPTFDVSILGAAKQEASKSLLAPLFESLAGTATPPPPVPNLPPLHPNDFFLRYRGK
jgi:hypothetical protein